MLDGAAEVQPTRQHACRSEDLHAPVAGLLALSESHGSDIVAGLQSGLERGLKESRRGVEENLANAIVGEVGNIQVSGRIERRRSRCVELR